MAFSRSARFPTSTESLLVTSSRLEPESAIAVRLYGDVAMIRYRSRLHMSLDGEVGAVKHYWHTDYELRDGRWQAV